MLHYHSYRLSSLTLLHSERPKLYGVLAILSAIGLREVAFETGLSVVYTVVYM